MKRSSTELKRRHDETFFGRGRPFECIFKRTHDQDTVNHTDIIPSAEISRLLDIYKDLPKKKATNRGDKDRQGKEDAHGESQTRAGEMRVARARLFVSERETQRVKFVIYGEA